MKKDDFIYWSLFGFEMIFGFEKRMVILLYWEGYNGILKRFK